MNSRNSSKPSRVPARAMESSLEPGQDPLHLEITRLQQQIYQLRLTEQRYHALRALIPDAIYRFNADGSSLLEMNGRGFAPDTHCPTDRWEDRYFYPEDREAIGGSVQAAMTTGKPFCLEHRFRRLDGTTGWCRSQAKPVFSADDEIVEWLGTVTDLTDAKTAEDHLQLAADSANIGIWVLDFSTNQLQWSEQMKSMAGLPAGREPTLEYFWSRVHPDDSEVAQASSMEAHRSGMNYDNEYRLIKPDGSDFWVRSMGRTFPAGDPNPRGMCGVTVDIHARKTAELALIRSQAHLEEKVQSRTAELEIAKRTAEQLTTRLQVATGAAKLGIWALDPHRQTMEWDRRMCDIYEYPAHYELTPVTVDVWKSYLHPEDRAAVEDGLQRRLQTRDATEMLYRMTLSGNRIRHIRSIAQTQFDASGEPVSVIGTNEDITEQVLFQCELRQAKQSAEAANLAKSKFLAAASHDLRQPLAAISLLLNTLRISPLDGHQSDLVRLLEKAQEAQKQMLNTLFDVAKLDAGTVPVKFQEMVVADLFVWAEDAFWLQCRDAGLRFELYYPQEPLSLHTDPALLKGILRNLIGNALKYCKAGRILVSLRKREGRALIQVWDTGIGIAPEHLGAIFDEFYQVGNEERDSAKGLGLGLSIVKRLAKLIGADIHCRSHQGRGSVFEVWVPLAEGASGLFLGRLMATRAPVTAPGIPPAIAGKSVTVVEDNLGVRQSMVLALTAAGMSARSFDQAETGLATSDICDADYYISDFRLPGAMNGLQLLYEIERRKGAPIRAVIMTGETLTDAYPELKTSPWKVMVKPCELADLLDTLAELS